MKVSNFAKVLLSLQNIEALVIWLRILNEDKSSHSFLFLTQIFNIHASFLNPYLDRTLELFNDIVFHSIFPEDEMEFENLPDSDIEYYFLEWYFTEDNDEVSYETELIETRKKLLGNI